MRVVLSCRFTLTEKGDNFSGATATCGFAFIGYEHPNHNKWLNWPANAQVGDTIDFSINIIAQDTLQNVYIYGCGSNALGSQGKATASEIMIEPGTTVTDYAEYAGETLSLSWQSSAGTVYGGNLDVKTGVLTVDMGIVDLGTITWYYTSTATRPYFRSYDELASMKPCTGGLIIQNIRCSQYKSESWSHVIDSDGYDKCICEGWIGKSYIAIRDTDYTDATTFKTAMSGVQLVYELATPLTYQLTPGEMITALNGQNHIWSDILGDLEVKYLKKG